MRLTSLGLLALSSSLSTIPTTHAFKDTSPFFLFSTSSDIPLPPPTHLSSAPSLSDTISTAFLPSCPSETYVLVSQPGVHARDYSVEQDTPELRKRVLGKDGSRFVVSEVVGEVDVEGVVAGLEKGCKGRIVKVDGDDGLTQQFDSSTLPLVLRVDFPSLAKATGSNRSEKLRKNDAFLAALLARLPTQKYTVIYTTTPRESAAAAVEIEEPAVYDEIDTDVYQNPLRTNMKRDNTPHVLRADDKESSGPLFERYQFLSPGIFMGLAAGLLFTIILYVGFSALSSLKVSYAAFEKDNSPMAMKKQQ
ncbi:hypothetical protein AJ79_04863 [Helicocarpus griseus UAMH5409]|uniref:Protein BIG1 n=1 Tax=Helicocarpus griseus UAMH5409 TaxID=1447875 RepID=A0A2B7XSB6_9EURO|nr:hypothetical protein AJ79_04863 [Helicocarpus griseus UAMH5409]